MSELKILPVKWVKGQIDAETRPEVRIYMFSVRPVDYINIPAHQAHLQAYNSRVAAFIRQNELDCIAVSDPNKALAEDILATLVDCPIPGESLA